MFPFVRLELYELTEFAVGRKAMLWVPISFLKMSAFFVMIRSIHFGVYGERVHLPPFPFCIFFLLLSLSVEPEAM